MGITHKPDKKYSLSEREGEFEEIFHQSSLGIIIFNEDGKMGNANEAALEIMGIPRLNDVLGLNLFENPYINDRKEELYKKTIVNFQAPLDLDLMKTLGFYEPNKKGIIFLDFIIFVTDSGFLAQIKDITEHRQADLERDITIKFLELVNESRVIEDLVESTLKFFKQQSGCHAVGTRLKEGNDYPYFGARGFPEEFIEAENLLCAYDKNGNMIIDSKGNPIVECKCGNVICGRFDPFKPFFTENGSFWTNSTTELLKTTTDADRLTRTRNRCNTQGYESMALIPLNAEKKLGLIQLNDQKEGMFSSDKIALWERLAGYLAIALQKFIAERDLKEAKDNLEFKIQERTTELRYQANLFENVNDAIIATDNKFNITSWNPAAFRMYGWSAEEVIGRNSKEILQTEFPGIDRSKIIESIAKKDSYRGEAVQKHRDGSLIPVESVIMVLKDEFGINNGWVAVNRDISQRKRSEKELNIVLKDLRRSNEELEQFAYVASHDLQEPLRTIASFTQLLDRRYKDKLDSDANEFMDYMVEASVRMKAQIEGLLEYSRVSTKGEKFEVVDLNDILEITVQSLYTSIKESNADIVHDKLPNVMGDAGQLQRVFQNLISNAIKFRKTEEPLKINISVRLNKEKDKFVFNVKDNGIGIEEQYLKRIFT
ncbi:MAG: PAS domain S-box protein, partial [Methanobacterium sp.]